MGNRAIWVGISVFADPVVATGGAFAYDGTPETFAISPDETVKRFLARCTYPKQLRARSKPILAYICRYDLLGVFIVTGVNRQICTVATILARFRAAWPGTPWAALPGLLLLIVVMTAHAWSAPLKDGFEVASVKLSANQNAIPGVAGIPPIPSGPIATLSLSHATFRGLLMRAYSIRYTSIIGPSWIDSIYYDVTAKVPTGVRRPQVAEMLQKLLAERFGLSVRFETNIVDGWAIVTASAPLKLKKTVLAGDAADLEDDGARNRYPMLVRKDHMRTLLMKGFSMQGLANGIWGEIGAPVQDLTGLKGAFDITLEGETDNPENISAGMSAASVKKSLRGYGLDFVRQKVQVKTLRVDSANKMPIPN